MNDGFEPYHSLDGEPQFMITEEKLKEVTKWKVCYQHLKKLNLHRLILRLSTLDTTKGHSNFQDSLIEKLLDDADELIELQKSLGDEEFIKKFKIGYEDEE